MAQARVLCAFVVSAWLFSKLEIESDSKWGQVGNGLQLYIQVFGLGLGLGLNIDPPGPLPHGLRVQFISSI